MIVAEVRNAEVAYEAGLDVKAELRPLADYDEDEEASIPDDSAVQAAPQLDGLAHPWGSTTEGGVRNVESRRALLRQLQQHQAVRNAGEHAAWLGIPEDARQTLHERCDPSRKHLNKMTWVTADSGAGLNHVEALMTWMRHCTGQRCSSEGAP